MAKRFGDYFGTGRPYLDGYRAYFVKSTAVVPGIIGGQFDAEFRFRTPPERDLLTEKLGDKVIVHDLPLLAGNIFIFNTRRKPFGDIRVRQALTLAVDRWAGGETLARFPRFDTWAASIGRVREWLFRKPNWRSAGQWERCRGGRAQAQRLLKEAGQENLSFKFLNRAGIESYTTGGIYAVDRWRRIGVKATHEQLESKHYQENLASGNFEVGREFISDYLDDPTAEFCQVLEQKGVSARLLRARGQQYRRSLREAARHPRSRRADQGRARARHLRSDNRYVGSVSVEPTHRCATKARARVAYDTLTLSVAGSCRCLA